MTQSAQQPGPKGRFPAVVFTLGEPSNPPDKPIFAAYQAARNGGPQDVRWEEHEFAVVKWLFARNGHDLSPFEALVLDLSGPKLTITAPFHAMSLHRGLWLMAIAVEAGDVEPSGSWPPSPDYCRAISALLAANMNRRWVHSMIIMGVKSDAR